MIEFWFLLMILWSLMGFLWNNLINFNEDRNYWQLPKTPVTIPNEAVGDNILNTCYTKAKKQTKKQQQKLWLSCVVFKFISKKIINLEDRNWKQTGAHQFIWSSKIREFHIFLHRQVFYYSYTSKTILNKMSSKYGYFGFHIDFHWSLGKRKQKSSNLENISILIHHIVHHSVHPS